MTTIYYKIINAKMVQDVHIMVRAKVAKFDVDELPMVMNKNIIHRIYFVPTIESCFMCFILSRLSYLDQCSINESNTTLNIL